jgi:hypothetical protein
VAVVLRPSARPLTGTGTRTSRPVLAGAPRDEQAPDLTTTDDGLTYDGLTYDGTASGAPSAGTPAPA